MLISEDVLLFRAIILTRSYHISKLRQQLSDPCNAGEYRDNTVTVCTQCPVNTVSESKGTSSCTACQPGYVSNSPRTDCGGFISLIFVLDLIHKA